MKRRSFFAALFAAPAAALAPTVAANGGRTFDCDSPRWCHSHSLCVGCFYEAVPEDGASPIYGPFKARLNCLKRRTP